MDRGDVAAAAAVYTSYSLALIPRESSIHVFRRVSFSRFLYLSLAKGRRQMDVTAVAAARAKAFVAHIMIMYTHLHNNAPDVTLQLNNGIITTRLCVCTSSNDNYYNPVWLVLSLRPQRFFFLKM